MSSHEANRPPSPASGSESEDSERAGDVDAITKKKMVEKAIMAAEKEKEDETAALEELEARDKKERRRKDYEFHKFIREASESVTFTTIIMIAIFINAITIAIMTDRHISRNYGYLFEGLDFAFIAIFSVEFIVKIYAEPKKYWGNGYNRFDFFILFISIFQLLEVFSSGADFTFLRVFRGLRVLRALRALRALRFIRFIRALQVIVTALLKTTSAILNLVTLLVLVMYVFGIVGYYTYGYEDDVENWGSLGKAMFSLFIFVTCDGWTALQEHLDLIDLSSRFYSIAFIFVGHFVFTNLFIGVIIQNLDEATEEDKEMQHFKRLLVLGRKRRFILESQKQDMINLTSHQKMTNESMSDVFKNLAGKLRHDDLVPMTHLMCNPVWIDSFIAVMNHQENTMYRLQQLQFDLSNILAEIAERRLLQEKPVNRNVPM